MPTKDENKLLRKSQFEKVIEELCKKIKAKFVSDVQLVTEQDTNDGNKEKYKIQVTKDGVGEKREPFLVTEWKDLKDVQEYTATNELDFSKHKPRMNLGEMPNGNVETNNSDTWGIIEIPVESSTPYTFLKKTTGNSDIKIKELDSSGNHVTFTQQNHGANTNGWYKISFTTNGQTKKIIIEVKLDEDSRSGQEMLIKQADVDTANLSFIPYNDELNKIAIGTEVSHMFDAKETGLTSNTTGGAIREIATKTKNCAILDKNNVFKEENIFEKDVFIEDTEMYVKDSSSPQNGAGGDKKVGRRDYTSHSHGNNGYVKSLVVRTVNTSVGNNTNVKVWAVTKGSDRQGDTLLNGGNPIVPEKQYQVKNAYGYDTCIEIDIDKYYDSETYFIYQFSSVTHTAYVSSSSPDRIFIKDGLNVNDANIRDINQHESLAPVYGIIGGVNVRTEFDKYAKLNGDNTFTGTNIFNSSLQISNGESAFVKVGNGTGNSAMQTGRISGNRNKTAIYGNSDGYVKSLEIRILDDKRENDNVTVSVYAMTKGATFDEDRVLEVITSKSIFKVQTGVSYSKSLFIPINKRYDENTYFMVHSHVDGFITNTSSGERGNLFHHSRGDLSAGDTLGTERWERDSWVVDYALYNGYNVVDEIDRLRKKIDSAGTGSGTVKKVNGISPTGDSEANVVLTMTTSFSGDDKLKFTTNGGSRNEMASIDCYTQTDAEALLRTLDTLQ